MTGFVTEALSRQHDRSAFSSGVDTLDLYLKQQAFQDIKRRLAGCFVALDGAGSIAGYYTLAATSVALDSLTPDLIRRLPRYPVIPAVLVGRLAVAADHQRKGLGRALVAEALMRTESFGIGAFALLLDAKDRAPLRSTKRSALVDFRARVVVCFFRWRQRRLCSADKASAPEGCRHVPPYRPSRNASAPAL